MQHVQGEKQSIARQGRGKGPVKKASALTRGGEIRLRRDFFQACYLVSLGTLSALDDVELYLIAFFEALVALTLDGTVVNEDVCPAFAA
jgi:hypothetical protein